MLKVATGIKRTLQQHKLLLFVSANEHYTLELLLLQWDRCCDVYDLPHMPGKKGGENPKRA